MPTPKVIAAKIHKVRNRSMKESFLLICSAMLDPLNKLEHFVPDLVTGPAEFLHDLLFRTDRPHGIFDRPVDAPYLRRRPRTSRFCVGTERNDHVHLPQQVLVYFF